jgi:hypothetical protein
MVNNLRDNQLDPLKKKAEGRSDDASGAEKSQTGETRAEEERSESKREAGEPPRETPPKHLPRPTRR